VIVITRNASICETSLFDSFFGFVFHAQECIQRPPLAGAWRCGAVVHCGATARGVRWRTWAFALVCGGFAGQICTKPVQTGRNAVCHPLAPHPTPRGKKTTHGHAGLGMARGIAAGFKATCKRRPGLFLAWFASYLIAACACFKSSTGCFYAQMSNVLQGALWVG